MSHEWDRHPAVRGNDELERRPDGPWKTIAQISPEDTVRLLAGEHIKLTDGFTDPAMRARYAQHVAIMREAVDGVCRELGKALEKDSAQTHQRMFDLLAEAKQGNTEAAKLLATLIGQLVWSAYE